MRANRIPTEGIDREPSASAGRGTADGRRGGTAAPGRLRPVVGGGRPAVRRGVVTRPHTGRERVAVGGVHRVRVADRRRGVLGGSLGGAATAPRPVLAGESA